MKEEYDKMRVEYYDKVNKAKKEYYDIVNKLNESRLLINKQRINDIVRIINEHDKVITRIIYIDQKFPYVIAGYCFGLCVLAPTANSTLIGEIEDVLYDNCCDYFITHPDCYEDLFIDIRNNDTFSYENVTMIIDY